ncbi:sarcosine oxidase subunit gamma [Kiloniella antarctica]|uniref:Sarcosine oxidase subunit gamma n=1 Tax=Kiloniella antarctica TaxID=1550907 RepID=A0ABW5BKZ3_9PROT
MVDNFRNSLIADKAQAMINGSVGGENGVTLIEVPFLAQVNIRGNADDKKFVAGVKKVTGLTVPTEPNTYVTKGDLTVFWMGPDEWQVVGAVDSQNELVAKFHKALDGLHVAVIDVSGNRTALDLSGAQARNVMKKSCRLDMDPQAFSVGQAVQTRVSKAPVLLQMLDDQPTYRMFVRPSFAEYLVDWLLDAMGEYHHVS